MAKRDGSKGGIIIIEEIAKLGKILNVKIIKRRQIASDHNFCDEKQND